VTEVGLLTYPLAGLLADPPGSDRAFLLAGVTIPLDDDLRLTEAIDGDLRFVRTNRGVIVHVRARTALDGSCARCLGPVVTRLRLRIDEEALPSMDLASGHPIDPTEEPDVLRLNAHHELDLEPLLREAIELAEPIAPLCRPDCPGLCVECGERLDSGHRPHDGSTVDPRLASLAAFRVDDKSENE
jgi:uncharacterized protein